MWRTTIHSQGLEIETPLRTFIEGQLRAALVGCEWRVSHVHVRLYGDPDNDVYTCYVRVDMPLSADIALGEAASDLRVAVERAIARMGLSVRSRGELPSAGEAHAARDLVRVAAA